MARTATGHEVLNQAKECLSKARTIAELRQAQSVVFPIEHNFTIEQTAAMLGISKRWVSLLRATFIKSGGAFPDTEPHGGRRYQNMSGHEESDFLAPFFELARAGGILVVSEIKSALDGRLGRNVPLSSVYNLLHRHGWRKIVPDTHHVKADAEVREAWKKNSRTCSRK